MNHQTGLIAGVLVFTVTVIVTLVLLVKGGSFRRMREQAQAYEAVGEDALRQALKPRPSLYDELVEASKTLPRKPAPLPKGPKGNDSVLQGWHTELHHLKAADAADLFEASNGSTKLGHAYDADNLIWAPSLHGPFESLKDMQESTLLQELPDGMRFKLVDRETFHTIGMACILANEPKDLRAEIGDLWVNPTYRSSPSLREAMYLLLCHLFGLKYRRVEMRLDAGDREARLAAESLGFKLEGVLRKHMIVKNRNRDTALLAVVNSDWNGGLKEAIERRLEGKDGKARAVR